MNLRVSCSGLSPCDPECCMRDPEVVEEELVKIGAMADDEMKLNSIITWCATHPDEVPLAIHMLMGRKHTAASASTEAPQAQ